ncbi:hypothetical protein [uncultured Nostoc sp.]|uniref:hypothetical protein n=1 Tax=uncultured Nostoc sp. TaxID=340711 RepID=UPI0035CBD0C6
MLRTWIASLIYQAMSTTGYAYAFGSTFKLRITAKISWGFGHREFKRAIAFLF